MNKKTIILFFLFLFSFLSPTYAQTLSGKITDAETNQPLEAVMISVLRGNTTIDYALTDAKGQFLCRGSIAECYNSIFLC